MFAVNMFTQGMLFSSVLLLLLAAPSWQVTVGSECEIYRQKLFADISGFCC